MDKFHPFLLRVSQNTRLALSQLVEELLYNLALNVIQYCSEGIHFVKRSLYKMAGRDYYYGSKIK
jgi:hypothetical protein